jgi:NAD(P)-dependent dehydrogenase (short-subunit alcohol dehydrogenase family)
MANLSGKIALVTGASRGIGCLSTLALVKGGAQVLVHCDRGTQEAEVVVAKSCLGGIAFLRRDIIRSLPGPLDGFPAICRALSDDMSDRREREMIAHGHHPIGCDAVQDGQARLDRLRRIVVEEGRPVWALQARHRVMGDVAHVRELLLARGEQD